MPEIIEKEVLPEEICIRCLIAPLFVSSKNKLKDNALMPPPNKREVSVLRLKYTTLDRCKRHGKNLKIKDNEYYGLAALKAEHIIQTNKQHNDIKAEIIYSPIDEANNYADKTIDLFTDSKGLPMHADIVYNKTLEKGEINTQLRKYAKDLNKLTQFVRDTNPLSEQWDMGSFTF